MISAHCNLCLLGSGSSPASASQGAGTTGEHHHGWRSFSSFFIQIEAHYLPQVDLELLGSSCPPSLSSQSTGITDVSHGSLPCSWLGGKAPSLSPLSMVLTVGFFFIFLIMWRKFFSVDNLLSVFVMKGVEFCLHLLKSSCGLSVVTPTCNLNTLTLQTNTKISQMW